MNTLIVKRYFWLRRHNNVITPKLAWAIARDAHLYFLVLQVMYQRVVKQSEPYGLFQCIKCNSPLGDALHLTNQFKGN